MRMTIVHREESGIRYTADAFARNIGKQIPVSTPSYQGMGTLVDAKVSDDGSSVEFTIDVDDRAMPGAGRVHMDLGHGV